MLEKNTNNPWSSDSLFAKSLTYLQQMEASIADDWKYGLWSSLSLELLARAALSNVSPVLLADSKNWRNITFALGSAPTAKKFNPVSISTKEVLARLTELLPEFTEEMAGFCSRHTDDRNAELHSGEVIFGKNGTSRWLPRFYQSCDVLLRSMEKTLDDFVSDSKNAESLIKSLSDDAAKSVKQDISAHSKVWSNKLEHEKNESELQATAWATRQTGHRVKCPSCNTVALLHGSPVGAVATEINEEDDEVIQRQTMLPSSFECIACGLKISGYSKLSACGLGDTFLATTTYTPAEFFELYTEDELQEARDEVEASYSYEEDFNE
ncbi:hypothetical protein K08M3_12870 [Vibrio alginolyticus]|uniref:Uncharacterized protein n=1 Tax=Vibrio alginolyticus TaxID=663 RepID=A0A1W6U528_VIBAL|nr:MULTISPECIES: hypothetical protein [Vibrio harveyi group]ARO98230.1 hypothetical protein K01M1_12850 [Vibrio alginolyticus]ARP02946.1 hypothetical protein K04M1_12960 [Vibrio alginolyticus]ARP07979.1 hypothetical protein K04M3_12630 [Vibrio alginolyticus]ARP13066.1 hypothetical protein K04M5_12640 [Vibrio alginolyticus]ARP18126.1 hypothetical protein K05K4_12880 [Vibrio alginolyticus]